MWTPERVLAISAHADDAELGAGGTLARWAREGSEIFHIIFSTLKQSELRSSEICKANEALGIDKNNIVLYDYPNRRFAEYRQDILQILSDAKFFKYDVEDDKKSYIVLTHCSTDTHQDHEVVYKESVRAFRNCTLLGYEDPWNMYKFDSRLSVHLSKEDLLAKCNSIAAHKSQSHRPFMDKNFIVGMTVTNGMRMRQKYAENFEVIRWIL